MTDSDPRIGKGGDAFDPFAQATTVPEDPDSYYDPEGRFDPALYGLSTSPTGEPPEVPRWAKIITAIVFGVPAAILWLAAVVRLVAFAF